MSIWVEFVKEYAKRNGIRYGCALGDPKVSREYRAMKERKGLKLTAKDKAELIKDKIMPSEPQFMNPKKSMKPMQIGTIGLRPTSDLKSDIAEPVADFEEVFEEPKPSNFTINRKGRVSNVSDRPIAVKAKRIAKKAPPSEQELLLKERGFNLVSGDPISRKGRVTTLKK